MSKDRYRRVRRALQKVKKFKMKGVIKQRFLAKVKQACFKE